VQWCRLETFVKTGFVGPPCTGLAGLVPWKAFIGHIYHTMYIIGLRVGSGVLLLGGASSSEYVVEGCSTCEDSTLRTLLHR
jgi:hypothetical protein